MTVPTRISRRLGFTGALLVHGGIAAFLLIGVSQALPTPLPPPVEAVIISLSDPSPGPQAGPGPAGFLREEASAAQAETLPPPQEEAPLPPPTETKPLLKKIVEKPAEQPRKPAPARPRRAAPTAQASPSASGGAGRGADGPAQAVAATAQARQTLLSALIARIEQEKRYPTAARRLGLEGVVLAEVRVDAQGRIVSVRTQEGQSHALLEKATRETLQRVRDGWRPVPVPEATTLNIPIRYSLKNS